jgi:hypothetical protein
MQMGESTSYSMLGSVINVSQDRDGVRIDAPHGWEIHDVHHLWNKNETYHWETGNIFHMTSGQVLHLNFNSAEAHTTLNALTMHVDGTPLNVHIGQKLLAFDVHLEPSGLHKQINVHGGPVHHVLNQFEQTAQEVTLTSKTAVSFLKKTVLNHPADHPGRMTFKADAEMSLKSNASIKLESPNAGTVSLSLNDPASEAILRSTTTTVEGTTEAKMNGGDSKISVQSQKLELSCGNASVKIENNILTTSGTETKLNGKVTLGNPATSNIASKASVRVLRNSVVSDNANVLDEITELKARLSALGG